jgi:hypothetical protein
MYFLSFLFLRNNVKLDACYVMLNVELDAIVNWMLFVMYILNVEDLLPVSCDVSAIISVMCGKSHRRRGRVAISVSYDNNQRRCVLTNESPFRTNMGDTCLKNASPTTINMGDVCTKQAYPIIINIGDACL